MKKAILTKKDQILHKLVLIETREPSGVLFKYVTPEQLTKLYTGMMVISDHNIMLKNITNLDEYRRMSFFYESIIHDYCKKYEIPEEDIKESILDHCNSLNEFKTSIDYYRLKKEVDNQEPLEEVGYKSSL